MVRSLSRRAFGAALLLAATAGFVDGFGFVYLGGYFVSFMSGNTTRASVDLAGGAFEAAALALLLIVSFVVGVMAGTLVPGRRFRAETRVLMLVVLLLALAAATGALELRWLVGMLLAGAMGAMNTVFARGDEVSFGITYMTGALVKFAQGLVHTVQGRPAPWARYLGLWVAIATGAAVGALAHAWFGVGALWVSAVALGLLLSIPATRRWLHV